ncbi:MAG: DRTGG domain-containing protein [Promethearchaeota archaeon]
MSDRIYIASNQLDAGRSSIILGMATKLKKQGKKVGYFKPWIIPSQESETGALVDPNIYLLKQTLNLPETLEELGGVIIPPNYLHEFLQQGRQNVWNKILDAWENISQKDYDIMLIEGHGYPSFGLSLSISNAHLAKAFDANPIIVARMDPQQPDRILDSILGTKERFVESVPRFSIINRVPADIHTELMEEVDKELANHGITNIGNLPENKILASPMVGEILKKVRGQILVTSEGAEEKLVISTLVGAMEVEMAMPYFRKIPNKAVITGADRADMIFGALETDTALLILTGGKYPDSAVISAARRKEVPMMLVPYDTLTAVKQIETMSWPITIDNAPKIKEIETLVDKHLNLDLLFR